MMGDTKIDWATKVWEPVRGCTPVSEGCRSCYARTLAEGRLRRFYPDGFGAVRTHPERLDQPLHWRKPQRVFVCSRSDLFWERARDHVPDEFLDGVFATMVLASRHTFLVLTKRPERMRAYMEGVAADVEAWPLPVSKGFARIRFVTLIRSIRSWPLPNVWLGVSIENQRAADERIPLLLQTPASVRFVSAEPLLGAVRLPLGQMFPNAKPTGRFRTTKDGRRQLQIIVNKKDCRLHWVIAGGESGPGARPAAIEWFRGLRDQCRAAGVAYFQKQLGTRPMFELGPNEDWHASGMMLGDGHGGSFRRDLLGGRLGFAVHTRDRKGADPAEWPEDLRIREYPA